MEDFLLYENNYDWFWLIFYIEGYTILEGSTPRFQYNYWKENLQ